MGSARCLIGCTQVLPSPDEYVWRGLYFYKDGWTTQWYGDISIVSGTPVAINATRFPDENFRNFLLQQDYGRDGVLSEREINDVIAIEVPSLDIKSLEGLQVFKNLWGLDCNNNQLTSLDVLEDLKVYNLECDNNQLTTLPTSILERVNILSCQNNLLTSLNFSDNPNLARLDCEGNQLTMLNLTNLPNLSWLTCSNNQLSTLTMNSSTGLEMLYCDGNQLTALDLSRFSRLKYLKCGNNQLTTIDVQPCIQLVELNVSHNPLTTLDLSGLTALTRVDCSLCQIAGDGMTAMFNTLPHVTSGELRYLNDSSDEEGNTITNGCISRARNARWKVMCCIWDAYWTELTEAPEYTAIDEENFPDENFRNWLLNQYYGTDGKLSNIECQYVYEMDVKGLGIADMKGIELFPSLDWLNCSENCIRDEQMEELVFSLPQSKDCRLLVYNPAAPAEQNFCITTVVRIANLKGWNVYYWDGNYWEHYQGEKAASGIKGDVNGDGEVGIGDIVAITNIMAGKE